MTTTIEHPSPDLAAAMSAQGVRNPDEHFSRLVDEFSPVSRAETAGVLSPANQREQEADVAPAGDEAGQASSLSPSAGPSRPTRGGGAPDWLIGATAAALSIVSIVIPAATGGGAMWFLTAVMLPALVGWVLFQREMALHDGVELGGRKPIAVIVLCTAATVVVFCAVVALAFAH